jgi:hypothetical protein
MDDKDAHDPDVIDLVIRLCTRVGMMMEDISPLALDASRDVLDARVAEVAKAARDIAMMAAAAEALLSR